MRKRLAIVLVVIAFVIGLAIALGIALLIMRRAARPQFASTPVLVQQIQSLSELVTVKYVLEKVVAYDDPKYFADLIPLGDNKLILLAHGVVKAGVNLSKLTNDDVRISDGKITLTIPNSTLTDAYLDDKHTQILDRQTGLLRRFDKDLERTARQYALAEIQRGARQAGIEREANERAREQLTTLLKTLGYKDVEIRTRSGK
jgi:hypothetical protein